MSGVLLRLQGVGKTYPPTVRSAERLRAFWQLVTRGRSQGGRVVLEDINLDVRGGESVAVIGENGAGKSTLLKIITGVLSPSTGNVYAHGTRAALLELGAGFDPEYSGLENIKLNAALLGLDQRTIADKLGDILDFADIGDSIDEPIKHYSSGMVVRLGFAVVAAVRPDLLITDEVLAVGDESFQKKCIRWMEGYLADGGTLLMVSHNMYQVQKLCRRACWVHHGRLHLEGDVFEVTQAYLAWHERKDADAIEQHRSVAGVYQISRFELHPADHLELDWGGELTIDLELQSPDDRAPNALVGIVRVDGTPVYGVATDHDGFAPHRIEKGRFACRLVLPNPALLPGSYVIRAHAMDPEGLRLHDSRELGLTVRGRSRELGLVRLEHEWR